ncbi:hypothetical protein MVES1_003925 [Malassezia vespertilionis]|uniref:Pre-mRNA-splicing factor SPF27 n=1 Tax=Malassezia vespertilionis TaxID=2020962 RepID=A0A2N1J7J7_9BASI|nr:uncharacterized protein MVES1_003925 [Malassezia vespertilionis]PKI82528.1 hypothetical protein MVES_003480 [Malassezia vespertilionis]WFD08549.1 hypothetical protein MVES1_003925 [Malassezia vespertilionis]
MSTAPVEVQLQYQDALPYYDQELDTIPNMRSSVEQLIAQEKATLAYDPLSLLGAPYQVFTVCMRKECLQQELPQLAAELERAERGEKLNVLDADRYQLPEPAEGLQASEEAWDASLRNASVQLAYMDGRVKNIELLRRYGANAWRLYNYNQEAILGLESQALDAEREEVEEVNRARKDAQIKTGDALSTYESRWAALVSQNLSLRVANLTAKAETAEYTRRAEQLQKELEAMDATS